MYVVYIDLYVHIHVYISASKGYYRRLVECTFRLRLDVKKMDVAPDTTDGQRVTEQKRWRYAAPGGIIGSSSLLHSEACNALRASGGVIPTNIPHEYAHARGRVVVVLRFPLGMMVDRRGSSASQRSSAQSMALRIHSAVKMRIVMRPLGNFTRLWRNITPRLCATVQGRS